MTGLLQLREESTAGTSAGFAVRFLPSLTDLAAIFPLLFLIFKMQGVSTLLGDGDTGWHIRTGDWILQHGRVPHADMFSFSKPGQPWFAWEWAWDALFALVHRAGGLMAVLWVNILLLGGTFALLFRFVRRECSSDVVSILITILALAGTSIHWLARPHLVSWLFVLIFCHVLSRAARGNTSWLWSLPVIMVLWTNLHGGFFIGIALVFAYGLDPLVRALKEHCARGFLGFAPFLWCGLACLAASFINPYGYALHQHVIAYLFDARQLERIAEFQSISFHHSLAPYFEFMLAVGAIAAFQGLKKQQYTEAVLIVIWAHLALVSMRNIPIFLFFAAPPVARTVSGWLDALPRLAALGSEFQIIDRLPRFHLVTSVVFALLFFGMSRPGNASFLRSEYDPARYPSRAVERLAGSSSKVFTSDVWGGYLIYRSYPSGRVFIDGRSDFYGDDFEGRYMDVMNVKYNWENRLDLYGIDAVLLPAEASLSGALKESRRWKVDYDDGIAVIFLRERSGAPPLSAIKGISPSSPDKGKEL